MSGPRVVKTSQYLAMQELPHLRGLRGLRLHRCQALAKAQAARIGRYMAGPSVVFLDEIREIQTGHLDFRARIDAELATRAVESAMSLSADY